MPGVGNAAAEAAPRLHCGGDCLSGALLDGHPGWGHCDPETELTTMHQPTYLTQDEAAAVCNKSYDTIRRRRRNGHRVCPQFP